MSQCMSKSKEREAYDCTMVPCLQEVLHKPRLLSQLQLGLLQLGQSRLQVALVPLHVCRDSGRQDRFSRWG
jgi:hypothetical protein